jgi:hypothetical protein
MRTLVSICIDEDDRDLVKVNDLNDIINSDNIKGLPLYLNINYQFS